MLGLEGKIREIVLYLKDVREGKLPPNNKIMFLLQVSCVLIVVNHKFIAKFELRGIDKGIFSEEQRHDVCDIHLCNDKMCVDSSHVDICGKGQRREGERKGKRKGARKGEIERKEREVGIEKEMTLFS